MSKVRTIKTGSRLLELVREHDEASTFPLVETLNFGDDRRGFSPPTNRYLERQFIQYFILDRDTTTIIYIGTRAPALGVLTGYGVS